MRNPARLHSWIRKYGTLGLLLAGVTIGVYELLVHPGLRRWIAWTVVGTLVCLLMATTALRLFSVDVSAQTAAAARATTSLPVTKVGKPREYRLTRLSTGLSWLDRTRVPRKNETWASLAGFQATEHGKPVPWEPVGIDITDGKGKKWDWSGGGIEQRGKETLYLFLLDPADGAQSRDEIRPDNRLWKLRVEFSRTADFDLTDLWTVRGVPVPIKGHSAAYNVIASTVLHRIKLGLRPVIPPGASLGESVKTGRRTPAVSVVLSPKREGLRLDLVNATDDQGRAVQTSLLQSGSGGCTVPAEQDPTYRYSFNLKGLQSGVKTADLTFALHESDYAEFTAKPILLTK